MNLKRLLGAPALALVMALTAACGGDDKSAAPTPRPSVSESSPCAPSGTALTIAAKSIEFDKRCLVAVAGQPFTITLDNADAAVAHNVAVYPDLRSTEALFKGENVVGPAMKTYNVPALTAGEYQFRCDLHPQQMQGDFMVE